MGENEIITVVGVRAGINPAPTTPPDGGIDGYPTGRRKNVKNKKYGTQG